MSTTYLLSADFMRFNSSDGNFYSWLCEEKLQREWSSSYNFSRFLSCTSYLRFYLLTFSCSHRWYDASQRCSLVHKIEWLRQYYYLPWWVFYIWITWFYSFRLHVWAYRIGYLISAACCSCTWFHYYQKGRLCSYMLLRWIHFHVLDSPNLRKLKYLVTRKCDDEVKARICFW